MFSKEYATNYIKTYSEQDDTFRKTIEALDTYNFGPLLTHGRSLSNLQSEIEKKYDNNCYDKYGFFLFDNLNDDEIIMYFISRYNIHFDEFIDYVVRHDGEHYEMAHKIRWE